MKGGDLRQYWEQIFNTMNDGLMLISPEGTILMVNRSFEQLTGYAAGEVLGKPCTLLECDACELTLHQKGARWCKLFEPDQQDMRRCRCCVLRKDGTYLPALKNASILRDADGSVLGAVETLTDISELDRLDRRVETLAKQLADTRQYQGIIGGSPQMQQVFHVIEKAADSDAPVIIYGESGTGKELVAQAIHNCGRRKNGPFVQMNCAALNAALLESELFGHIKGAFTGAYRHRRGRFEAVHTGDMFLDEIGDIPLSVQVKLLRVLETQRFERVGDHQSIGVDVRIISATNKNLQEMIARKQFREDLFFRINVIPIHLPPLRERKADIPVLVNHFVGRLRQVTGKPLSGLTPEALQRFMDYPWPGNVRELKSALEYGFVIAEKGRIDRSQLPPQIRDRVGERSRPAAGNDAQEKTALIRALQTAGGNKSEAARILGVNRVTVWNRMRKYGIDLERVLKTDRPPPA